MGHVLPRPDVPRSAHVGTSRRAAADSASRVGHSLPPPNLLASAQFRPTRAAAAAERPSPSPSPSPSALRYLPPRVGHGEQQVWHPRGGAGGRLFVRAVVLVPGQPGQLGGHQTHLAGEGEKGEGGGVALRERRCRRAGRQAFRVQASRRRRGAAPLPWRDLSLDGGEGGGSVAPSPPRIHGGL